MIVLAALAAAVLVLSAYLSTAQTTSSSSMPQTITVTEVPKDQVALYFQSGKIDMYLNPWALPTNVLAQLQQNPNVTFVSPGMISAYDLLFNPYPSNTTFNPFAYRQFRFLMNYLVHRSAIVQQVFHGLATPMVAWPGPFALNSYLLIVPFVSQYNIHYDPTYVNASIWALFRQINQTDPVWHGRILWINGKWYYIPPNSTTPQPVTIIFFIRNDDPYRYQMGLMFSEALQSLGFTIKPIYGTLTDALSTVYSSNPASMEWQIYTEAWSITPMPWDTGAGASFCASWSGNMPGWGTSGYWQYSNATIDKITQWVSTGNFTSLDQFKQLSKIALSDCFAEAVRVWQVARAAAYPVASNLRNFMPSVLGLETPYGVKFAYVPGKTTLTVGMLHVKQYPWNPIQWIVGVDAYTADVVQGWLFDPFAYYDPFSGEPMPFRGAWSVQLSPNSSAIYPVPPNAVVWNATLGKWVTVGPGKMARAVIRYYYNGTWLGTNWQDGQPITMADVLMYWYWYLDLAQGAPDLGANAAQISDLQGALQPSASTVVGLQFFPNGTVVVYSNYWFPDPNIVGSYYAPGYIWSIPWELYAAMFQAMKDGKLALTSSEAQSMKIPTADLTASDSAKILAGYLQQWSQTGFIWDNGSWACVPGLGCVLNSTEAVQDYQDALSFYNQYGHLFISNGPYILKSLVSVTPQSAVLVLWSGYPFSYSYWYSELYGTLPSVPSNPLASVVSVTPTTLVAGQSNTITVTVQGVGLPRAYVYVTNPQGQVVYSGTVTSSTPGQLTLTLPASALTVPGVYTLNMMIYTDKVTVPTTYSATLAVVTAVTVTTSSVATVTTSSVATTTVATTPGWVWALVAVVVILIIAVAVLAIRRR
ncbi:oligopeptide ABC transporter, substrate-binding protein [Thermoproteus uzoniensis 768-20]|uniref:Oligopeptide ABC transporter, substrate-binding protein n=1 Tax=Thermoproteus uzoniensis (strain 768-20) TaxID=999630 RepID=F2L0I7_THEU7|nr:oligopeptide ABC transporter, substrate-binding protein [Thermoproteus uzoniensis 768-20]